MNEIKPQFIQAAGVELVILTRAEYDELLFRADSEVEDALDAALFATRVSDLRHGRDERLPPEVTAAMLDGDSLLQALREWRRLSQAELAQTVGLTQSDISNLENRTKQCSSATLQQIAAALDVPSHWMVTSQPTEEPG